MEHKFESTNEYKEFLSSKLKEMGKSGEYNIFAHCITCYTPYKMHGRNYLTEQEELQAKMKGIMSQGLELDGSQGFHYGSILETMTFLGNLDTINVNELINYEYYQAGNPVHTVIIAMPKFMTFDGKKVELSSFNGNPKALPERSNRNCLFDTIKGSYLPNPFTFGFQIVNKQTGEVECITNDNHYSLQNENQRKPLQNELETSYKKLTKQFGTTDIIELIKHSSKEFDIVLFHDSLEP